MFGTCLVRLRNVKEVIRFLLWADRRRFTKFGFLDMRGAMLVVRLASRGEGLCRRGAFFGHGVEQAVCFGTLCVSEVGLTFR